MTLRKQSPLAGAYRELGARTGSEEGWAVALGVAALEREVETLGRGAGLADWSHLGKISIRGPSARERVSVLLGAADAPPVGDSRARAGIAALSLADDELLLVTGPGREGDARTLLGTGRDAVVVATGALACMALAGPRVPEILERSCATDLGRRAVPVGGCLQTSMHFVHITFWRTERCDVVLCARDYARSLFDALVDVGVGVGMIVCGLDTIPAVIGGAA